MDAGHCTGGDQVRAEIGVGVGREPRANICFELFHGRD